MGHQAALIMPPVKKWRVVNWGKKAKAVAGKQERVKKLRGSGTRRILSSFRVKLEFLGWGPEGAGKVVYIRARKKKEWK